MLSVRDLAVVSILLIGGGVACDEESKQGAQASAEKAAAASAAEQGAKADAKLFDKEIRKKACELLPAKMVAKTFDVPEKALEQSTVMGCIYDWEKDGRKVHASVMSIRAHKTLDRAKTWFENSTKNRSKKENEAAVDQVKKRLKEKKELDTEIKKKAANEVTNLIPTAALSYERVEGVGDEAAVNQNDGNVRVRVGNLTFTVAAYKGKKQPEFKPDTSLGTKGMIDDIKKKSQEWHKTTVPQRKKAGVELARAIANGLE